MGGTFDIVAFDVRQTAGLEVTLRVQKINDRYNDEQEQRIRTAIKRYIGDDCDLIIEYVDKFEALPNGKRRYFMV